MAGQVTERGQVLLEHLGERIEALLGKLAERIERQGPESVPDLPAAVVAAYLELDRVSRELREELA